MKKLAALKSLASIANELDIMGFEKEANAITHVMRRLAQIVTAPVGEWATDKGFDALHDVGNGLGEIGSGLVSIIKGVGEGAQSLVGFASLPLFALIDIPIMLAQYAADAVTKPYVDKLEYYQKLNSSLAQQLLAALKDNNPSKSLQLSNSMKANNDQQQSSWAVLSNIVARKKADQYKGDTAGFQNTIDYAVKNNFCENV